MQGSDLHVARSLQACESSATAMMAVMVRHMESLMAETMNLSITSRESVPVEHTDTETVDAGPHTQESSGHPEDMEA